MDSGEELKDTTLQDPSSAEENDWRFKSGATNFPPIRRMCTSLWEKKSGLNKKPLLTTLLKIHNLMSSSCCIFRPLWQ
jgi:hypothetical protein